MDAEAIAHELQGILGLELSGGVEEVEGGRFTSIRPLHPSRPSGFSMLLSRTSRRVEAGIRLDNHAAALLRTMAASDQVDFQTFEAIMRESENSGVSVRAIVDDSMIGKAADFPDPPWTDIILECETRLPGVYASAQQVFDAARASAFRCLSLVLCLLEVEPVDLVPENREVAGLPEGAKSRIEVNRYERNPLNRQACLGAYGPTCQVCSFNFGSVYGELGQGYIHVHHIVPVSQMPASYRVNPLTDLIPVCPNCHAMLHRTDTPMSPASLRELIESGTTTDPQK